MKVYHIRHNRKNFVLEVFFLCFICQGWIIGQYQRTPSQSVDTVFPIITEPSLDKDSTITEITPIPSAKLIVIDSVFKKIRDYDIKNGVLDMIVVNQDTTAKQRNELPDEEEQIMQYLPYEGKVIRKISFKSSNVFGRSISDTNGIPAKRAQCWGNSIHIHTQKRILQNRLIFNTGDTIVPYTIADNERLYRSMPNIKDAGIFIKETDDTGDSVDVEIITKDVWPIGVGLELLDIGIGNTGLWNKNVLGLGHEVYYYFLWNTNKEQPYGNKIRYRINNINSTFISADAIYEKHWQTEAYRLYFNRDFYTPETKYAGGIGLENVTTLRLIEFPDSIIEDYPIKYQFHEFWIGRAISLNRWVNFSSRRNIITSARIMRYDFLKRPEVTATSLYDYHSRTMLFASLSTSKQSYFKSRLVYGFGKPEDIPTGSLLKLTVGYEFNEFNKRPYAGISYDVGSYAANIGYLYHKIEYGGFFHNGIEQGVIGYIFKYFTPLLNADGRNNYRIFMKCSYREGLNRYNDEYLTFDQEDGIRGLTSRNLKGNQRLNFSLEDVYYSPLNILGFRFVYFVFLDLCMITANNESFLDNPIYSGFGGGVRIRNENLVFNTLLIRLGYYPRLPENPDAEYYNISGISIPTFDQFADRKPDILNY